MLNTADNKISTFRHIVISLLDRSFEMRPLAGIDLDIVVICFKTILVVPVLGTLVREDKDMRNITAPVFFLAPAYGRGSGNRTV